ncbi:hypothetical protein H1P_6750002 [Hyella patelloides LEGE 07179]|uniref:Uncharacterized protein n=1 Tax=Hyella patelloides LEGE 07179 TaxID=945734 RepID=A0A563W2V8_9CYAN|nr:hypothetical protein [Hyella patelloides]VEP18021.1 hypothetical protein H1P_6750002 [Hyella patelloides LEGE 07179]
MKKIFVPRNIVRFSFSILTIATSYWLLNKRGYLPPINYFFSQTVETNNLQLLAVTNNLLNYQLPITEIIQAPIEFKHQLISHRQ